MKTLSVLAAGLCLILAQPASTVSAQQGGATTTPAVGKCMWEQFPEAGRTAIVGKATLDEVYKELSAQVTTMGSAGMLKAGAACGVGADQFRSAGNRVADRAVRLWAEKQLSGRASPQKLDQVYRTIPAADKQALSQGFSIPGGLNQSPGREAVDRYLERLGIRRTEQAAFAAGINYLISRLGDEKP